jgi:glyoxylate utilization-related uncharacterized protein
MRGSKADLPVALAIEEGVIRMVDWGGMTIEYSTFTKGIDPSPLFKGLPNDECQCPHFGFVIKGRLRYTIGGREEVYSAGDVYYVPAGHTPVIEADTEYVEFSPAEELKKTMAVVERNFAAMQAAE